MTGGVTVVLRGSRDTGAAAPSGRTGDGPPPVDLARSVAAYTDRFTPDGGYRPPSRIERQTVAAGVALLLDHRIDQAEERLAEVDFAVRTVTDSATGRGFAEVYDRVDQGPAPRGWGRVLLDLDHPVRWSVQVPHPVADHDTELLGVRVLRGTPGGLLIIAGAHRKSGEGDAADVAHRRDTVFDAICAELVGRRLPGIQLHGFARDSAPRYDAIASTGAGTDGRAAGRALADALRAKDFAVCRAWARSCPLPGRDNVQGREAAAAGVPFLHVELAPPLRTDGPPADRTAQAIGTVTGGWAEDARAG
ncbi:hypothetical protein [Streptomyces mangrovisoli]|uniref:hypothetical protein n=1 Tax=Streptomyces mangrovisoli TaxID=1428628 RepID=UPI001F0B5C69|nr:hypothetical protein [Streptomyces mangrovisoli]